MAHEYRSIFLAVTRWRLRREQKDCFHHEWTTGDTWVKSQLVDLGRAKIWWCTECNKMWRSGP